MISIHKYSANPEHGMWFTNVMVHCLSQNRYKLRFSNNKSNTFDFGPVENAQLKVNIENKLKTPNKLSKLKNFRFHNLFLFAFDFTCIPKSSSPHSCLFASQWLIAIDNKQCNDYSGVKQGARSIELNKMQFLFNPCGKNVNALYLNLIKEVRPSTSTFSHDHEIYCKSSMQKKKKSFINLRKYIRESIECETHFLEWHSVWKKTRHEFNWKWINIQFMFTPNTITSTLINQRQLQ